MLTMSPFLLCFFLLLASTTHASSRLFTPARTAAPPSALSSSSSKTFSPTQTVAFPRGGKLAAPSAGTAAILGSSFFTAAIMYPVDLVRGLSMMNPGASVPTLLTNFKATYGVTGFFTQGLAPEVSRATLMRGLKFTLYPALHQRMFDKPVSEGTTKSKLAAACVTSVPEVLIIMPLEVSKVILTTDAEKKFGNR